MNTLKILQTLNTLSVLDKEDQEKLLSDSQSQSKGNFISINASDKTWRDTYNTVNWKIDKDTDELKIDIYFDKYLYN